MFAIVTASGRTKEEIIAVLKEVVSDFENEAANNCIAENFEYDLFPNSDFIPMAQLLKKFGS